MSDLSMDFLRGYLAAPIVEACRRHGLLTVLELGRSCGRRSLLDRLHAKEAGFDLALEILESLGWIERDGTGDIRRTPASDREADLDLTPLYGVAPEELLKSEPHEAALRRIIERCFVESGGEDSAWLRMARGAVVVPMAVASRAGASVPGSVAGLARKYASEPLFGAAVSLRPVLHAVGDVLFGDRTLVSHTAETPVPFVEWLSRLASESTSGAEEFLTAAARAGLMNDEIPLRFPHSTEACRFSLHSLTRRDFTIRNATGSDLERLDELEKLCWRQLRTPKARLRERLRRYPEGQFVLVRRGEIQGVAYSQRIADEDELNGRTAANVHELHRDDGRIVQILAVNVDPGAQDGGYGDQLLEFMLQRCGLMTDVERVVGVTLCKNYDAARGIPFEKYVHLTGSGQDSVLTFHDAHGGSVVKVLAGYRPRDRANLTNGVLVSYDILERRPRRERLGADGTERPLRPRPRGCGASEIAAFVRSEAARLLGIGEGEVDADRPVMEMGLDSADLLKLQRLCEERFGLRLPTGYFFEHSSVGKVVDDLSSRLSAGPEEPRVAAPPAPAPAAGHPEPPAAVLEPREAPPRFAPTDIAVVGMSCKLPGGIEAPEELWRVLAAGKCVIGPFPATRGSWPGASEFPGVEVGGFVEDVAAFDAPFFRISPAEAQVTDPQQRLLLELAWAGQEDAGILPAALKGTKTGVFVGASNCDYSRLAQEAGIDPEAHHGVGSSLAILANRISYFFDLSGPSLVVDTACSSSLVALHSAVRSLRSGESSAALVGGVNLICHPDLSIAYQKAGMLAPDGRCKVFDAGANGYVRSEGAAVLLLKPLPAAIADGNRVHAVIRGSATNHGGLAGGLTVPNPQKQKELLLAAWEDAGVAAGDLGYFEAHGTGTPLGDPIEVQGIQAAFAAHGGAAGSCLIGSVKSNLGHLEPAAGVAGLLKVILSFRHRQIPASVNFAELNPRIQLAGTPLLVADRLRDWVAEAPRVAGLSSFGSGGTNAHVVLQEYPADRRSGGGEGARLFVLSAASAERLASYADAVVRWLERPEAEEEFDDAICTWQCGRTAMRHRLAVRVRDRADLLEKLRRWLAGDRGMADTFFGEATPKDALAQRAWQTRAGRQAIDRALAERDLESLAALWTSGAEVDWRGLYADGGRPRTVSVPTYPFARERHWIETGAIPGRSREARHTFLHPLLHTNSSTFGRQSYGATFTGAEFFLADHRVRAGGPGAEKVLPAVAYLEMARAAIERALPDRPGAAVELRDTAWVQPIVVAAGKEVSIALVATGADQIEFEVQSRDAGEEILHCRGRAIVGDRSAPATLDLAGLRREMTAGSAGADEVYAALDRTGLVYGPSFRGIQAIHRGSGQLLAEIRLPEVVEETSAEYVLHPVLLDGAVQAAMRLLDGESERGGRPRLPFALEELRIVSAPSPGMVAWVRHAPGAPARDGLRKVDIDLCDARGNVCVEMRGLSSRERNRETRGVAPREEPAGTLLAAPVWEASGAGPGEERGVELAAHHVVLCDLPGIDLGELRARLPRAEVASPETGAQANVAQRYAERAVALFEVVKGILERKPRGRVLVQLVVPGRGEASILSGLAGLLQTAALENPLVQGQVILTGEEVPAGVLADRLRREASLDLATLVRFDGETRLVSRWREVTADEEAPLEEFSDDGVYLITGGLGGLGVLFAKEILARTGHARVVLTGRSGLTPERQARLSRVSAEAGRLIYRRVDLADPDDVSRLVAGVREECGRLDGILHGAGMIADGFILKKSGAEFREVLAPKVAGAFHLDQATREAELDFFVLFSSFASALGNVGQADYAAANGFLDRFAAHRNALVAAGRRQGRTRSINWPYWEAGGMRMDPGTQALLQEATGLRPMGTASGLRAFHRCLALSHGQVLVLEGDLERLRERLLRAPAIPARPERRPGPAPAAGGAGEAEMLAERTRELLRKECAAVLKMPPHQVDPAAPLEEYGIDSMLAMRLTGRLEETFGPLPKTLFFEYRTLADLADYFAADHQERLAALFRADGNDAAAPAPARPGKPAPAAPAPARLRPRAAEPVPQGERDDVAIIGLSGRYPESFDVAEYWKNLREGRDCIVEVPRERWDWREHYSEDRSGEGRHYSKWGGFIAGVDEFEPLFFNISPRDARYIDPQERLFLQHAWMALEDAGYTRAGLRAPDEGDAAASVGVYVGVMWSEYQLLGARARAEDVRMGFAGNPASIANRVSYALDLHGPSMTVDTMCSSSLSAIHVACQDLRLRHTRLAIAGGVNVSVHPHKYLLLSVGQFISSDGHCQSFGEGGDGYIPGEGVGAVVLKRLSDAQRDGDNIYGVIRGSALTHGGKTNGYTVPNPQAQAATIRRALSEARVDARHVSYVEAHGTGTKLGDPIEIAALSRAFGQDTADTQFCLIGSAKSNIGHCESAAGIAGLTKVLLQMRHQEIVPSLHSAKLNPHIDFSATPFVVNQRLTRWEQPVVGGRQVPRIAGISSFGAGGSNAHMILEEYQAPEEETAAPGSVAVLLSARTAGQLREKARALLELARARRDALDLASMAYTLQVGREAMEERLGFVAGSVDELIDTLGAYVGGTPDAGGIFQGRVDRGDAHGLSLFSDDADLRTTVDKWLAGGKLPRLLELWVKGAAPDWRKLYGGKPPRRMSLPAYPFARERHWIDVAPEGPRARGGEPRLHPLLHRNTSDLSEQSYGSTFSGDELFLAGIAGEKVLSSAACLEMARAAVADAARAESAALELRDVVWGPPASVEGDVRVVLSPADEEAIDFEITTGEGDRQIVHLQGRAIPAGEPVPERPEAGRPGGPGSRAVELRAAAAEGCVLHPLLLEEALRAAAGTLDGVPAAIDRLRIVSPCAREMRAWIRPSETGDGLDIDLGDPEGKVAVRIEGLTFTQRLAAEPEAAAAGPAVAPASATSPATITFEREEIHFLDPEPTSAVPVAAAPQQGKPAVALAAPASEATAPARPAGRPRITLADPAAGAAPRSGASPASVRLFELGHGIFSLEVRESGSKEAIARVALGLRRAREENGLKVLMLAGLERCFPRGTRDEHDEAVERGLYRELASFPYPVVALARGDVLGAGVFCAALCDFMVCAEDARLCITDAGRGFHATPEEASLLGERFGALRAHDLLHVATSPIGEELREKGWTCPIAPPADLEERARELALLLATKSRDALRLLKEHLTRRLAPMADALTRAEVPGPAPEADGAARPVAVVRYGREGLKDVLVDPAAHFGAIVLVGEEADLPDAVVADVRRLVLESRIPVVAATPGDARGNAWLAAELCDARVYGAAAVYSTASIGRSLAREAAALFAARFGGAAAAEILLTGRDCSGLERRRRLGVSKVVEREEVVPAALALARALATTPPSTVDSWRRELAGLSAAAPGEGREAAALEEVAEEAPLAPGPIALRSRVVTATAHPEGIVVVEMHDREAKNMFSDALVEGVREAFAKVGEAPGCRVVVLTGYDGYFASGGTKETLLSIQRGEAKFTDLAVFHAALECPVPVIAAMQGHGIGAGWSMGLFADLVLLGEESRYVSPYMDYGFTPGAGATSSLPEKLGTDLARESLLTARPYTGRELRERGVALRVVPRAEMAEEAIALARLVARFPRLRSIEMKRRLSEGTRATLEETYRSELALHEKTFVGRAETLARIEESFPPAPSPAAPAPAAAPAPSREAARAAGDGDALSGVTASLRSLLAGELQMKEADLDERAQFVDLGLDSITGVTWIRKINQKYGTSIEATKVYSFPTLAQLARHVTEEAEKRGTLPRPGAAAPAIEPPRGRAESEAPRPERLAEGPGKAPSRRTRRVSRFAPGGAAPRAPEPIAVIGMAGQFPQARNLDEFWRNIAEGRDCITPVPKERWDPDVHYRPGDPAPGKTYSRWAGMIEDYDRFDPLFFSISPTEAESMDPQQRLFLQACWHAIENAGYDARALSGTRCGVFAGCTTSDYHGASRAHRLSAHGFTGGATSVLAGRISYVLNLQGPSVSVDTACSSALVALAQACESLSTGGSDAALAGGVYAMTGPEMHIRTSQSGMLSPDGRCFTFDQRANGFVPGEGVGVVLLKRLRDARRDGDIIQGVIEGWGVNQDGKTNGITAPNPEAQTRLVREIHGRFGVDPAEIQLVEAHGTGTKLGDPIEVEGLKASFARSGERKGSCALGSVKSNIGHCLTAAGIAGTLKVLLALRHRQLPPTINFERLNEHLDLEGSPFYVNTRLRDWARIGASPRRAAVSSFGFGGTNAHLIVGEYEPPDASPRRRVDRSGKALVPLSARTAERLAEKARDLLGFLRGASPTPELDEIAYTLQVGREAMDERVGFVVGSVEELAGKLEAWVEGEPGVEGVRRGRVRRGDDATSIASLDAETRDAIVERWIGSGRLTRVLELWVNGLELDGNRLYGAEKPRRVCLPLYPFARERYWIDPPAADAASSGAPAGASRHPLVQRDTSDLGERRHTSTFTGEEFFLRDHRVRTDGRVPRRVLPGAACLEMVREAVGRTWPGEMESCTLEIRDAVWLSPVVVEGETDVSVTLLPADGSCVEFEVHTAGGGEPLVHCQGQAAFVRRSPPARLDLEALGRRMRAGTLDAVSVYAIFEAMGLHYGPAFQGIGAIELGRGELLARLRLPRVVEATRNEFVLHPSLLDAAFQGSIGLLHPEKAAASPAVPFAMESLRVFAPCAPESTAWVRRSGDGGSGQLVLDLDLCDERGDVSAQVRGLALRLMENEPPGDSAPGTAKDSTFYEHLVAQVASGEVSADEAAKLG